MKYIYLSIILTITACANLEGDTSSYPLENEDERRKRWQEYWNDK